MPDHQEPQHAVEEGSDLSAKIGRSLASVWARYVGARPPAATLELDNGVVRWVLDGGTSEFDEAMAAGFDTDDSATSPRTFEGYKRETSVAVAKATGSRVVAMISRHDQKTGIASETFILRTESKRY